MTITRDDIEAYATAVAVLVASYQLWQGRRQARTQFEDGLNREYREIAQRIPTGALLHEDLESKEYDGALDDFYRYIDLTNEQAFLRKNGRVSRRTWQNWQSGMKANLSRGAFGRAWSDVKERAGADQFSELRRVEAEQYKSDPRFWKLRSRLGLYRGPAKPQPTGVAEPPPSIHGIVSRD